MGVPSGPAKRRRAPCRGCGPFRFGRRRGAKQRKRKEIFRQTKRSVSPGGVKSLRSLGARNQRFREIVCFQRISRLFVSPVSSAAKCLNRPSLLGDQPLSGPHLLRRRRKRVASRMAGRACEASYIFHIRKISASSEFQQGFCSPNGRGPRRNRRSRAAPSAILSVTSSTARLRRPCGSYVCLFNANWSIHQLISDWRHTDWRVT